MDRFGVQKIATLFFLLGAAGLYADNPFVGAWTDAGGEAIIVAADTIEISGAGEATQTYPYTFDAKVITIGKITWLYIATSDGSEIYLLTWGPERPVIILWNRAPFEKPGTLGAQ